MRTEPHVTRRGAARRRQPVATYGALLDLPSRPARDDRRIILHVGDLAPTCSDCGAGTLCWAEAGYVPWHRICDCCGSHWDLYPVNYYLEELRAEGPLGVPPSQREIVGWLIRDRDFRAPIGRAPVSNVPGSPLHLDLVPLITREHVLAAVADARGGTPCLGACWARRARFYRGR